MKKYPNWNDLTANYTSYISKNISKNNMGKISSHAASILMVNSSAIKIIFKPTHPIRVTANLPGLFLAEFLAILVALKGHLGFEDKIP